MATVIVLVLTLYKRIEVESSEIIVTHDKIAPEMIPESIIGVVILVKVLRRLLPKLSAASSMLGEICCKLATEDRIVYGSLLTDKDMIKMKAVPVIIRKPLPKIPVLNEEIKAIPRTVPGTI